MISRKRVFAVLSLALAVMLFSTPVDAGLINGSFETQMTNWTTVGPNSSVANGTINGFDATDGNFYASLGTGPGALPTFIHDIILNNAGLPSNFVSANFGNTTEGATLFQTFTLGSNRDRVSFDWNFVTNESPQSLPFNDVAFAMLYNQTTMTLSGSTFLDTFSPLSNGGPEFAAETGWLSHTFGGLIAGHDYTILFGVFDREDAFVSSGLLVDNVRSIPEPSAALSVILAGVFATGIRRRLRNKS